MVGGRSPGQTPAPRAPAPPQARRRGSREHICRGCGEQRNLPPASPEELRGRSLVPRLGASVSGNAHRTLPPPPTSQTGTSRAKGCGLAKVAQKARPRRPAPPPSPVPGPRRVPLTMLAPLRAPSARQFPRADSNPPSKRRLQARMRAGPERPGGRRLENAASRPGGRAPEPDWRGRDALRGARSPAPEAEGKPGLTHRRAASPGPGPRMWGAGTGTGGNPRPPRANLSPARARRAAQPPRAVAARAPCRLRPAPRGFPAGRQSPRSRRPRRASSQPPSSSSRPCPFLFVSRTRQLPKRRVQLPDPRRLLLGKHCYPF